MAWHHKLHRGATLGARLEADVGGIDSAIANLPQDITINGATVSPTFRYEGRNATTGLWTATVGEDLTGAGTGGLVGLDTPLLNIVDKAVNGDAFRWWAGNSISLGNDDFVFEIIIKPGPTWNGVIVGQFDGSTNPFFYIIRNTKTSIRLYLDDGPNFASVQGGTFSVGAWMHLIVVADRSGSAQWFADGDLFGSATSLSSIGDMNSAVGLSIASRVNSASNRDDSDIAYAAMYQRDNWLDTHLQTDLVQERFARLTGTYVPGWQAWPTQANLRNSVATLEKTVYGEERLLFTVGARWPRLESVRDLVTDRDDDGVVSNSFSYSEDLSAASWNKIRVSIDTSTGVFDHRGKTEMHGIVSNSGTNTHYVSGSLAPSSNWKHLFSAEFAAGDIDTVRLQSENAGAADVWCQFGLRGDGVVGLDSGNLITAGIELLAAGRYRCYIVYDGGVANHSHRIYCIDDETVDDLSHTGDGLTVNLYVTAIQHDYSEAVDGRETLADYVRTVGAGRIVGRPGTGFMCESQHTNLLTYSEQFDNAAWFKLRLSVTPDSVTAPDGNLTADTLVEDGTAAATRYTSQRISLSAGTYTIYGFFKAANRSWVLLSVSSTTDGVASVYYDIASGALGTETANDNAGIIDFGDGWFFCWMTDTRATDEAHTAFLSIAEADGDVTFDGLSQDSIYVWGAQATATSYPVSYIKTEGATVTRLADAIRYEGLSLPAKGALAADYLLQSGVSVGHLANAGDSSANRCTLYLSAANRLGVVVVSSGSVGVNFTGTASAFAGEWAEGRLTYETDNVILYENGSQVALDSLADMPASLTKLIVGGFFFSSFELNGLVRVRLFNKPTLKDITEFE